jgi:mono/diheme cytochrome c family protein
MRKQVYALVVLVVAVALLAACGGGGGGAASGGTSGGGASADNGKAIFAKTVIGSNPGCITCHSLDGTKLVGPSAQGVASRAGSAVSGQSAEQYLRQSILAPNEHVVEGYPQGVMPAYQGVLQDAEVNDLVAYLLTLK